MMISLTAVCMAGLFLTVTALLALRLYADHNLKLVARAISYTTERPWSSMTRRRHWMPWRPSPPGKT
jgi:hypothetical protein